MRILSHYFIARYLGLFATVLIAALLLLTAIELLAQLDSFETADSSASSTLDTARHLSRRLLAYYLPDLLPIASLIAVFVTFASAGRSLESLAIQAGGIRLGSIIVPVLLAALMLSLASGILHETLVLQAEQALRVQGEQPRSPVDFGQKAFWLQKGRTITNIAHADPQSRVLAGVEIFERSLAGPVTRVIRAKRARITENGEWIIENARIWSFDPAAPDAPPVIARHSELVLDIDALSGADLLQAEPGFLPLGSLADYLDAENEPYPSRRRQLSQRFHDRLSRPCLILLFAWIALPFGLRVDGRGHAISHALGAALATGLFFALRGLGITLAGQGMITTAWTVWSPIALMAALAAGVLLGLGRRP